MAMVEGRQRGRKAGSKAMGGVEDFDVFDAEGVDNEAFVDVDHYFGDEDTNGKRAKEEKKKKKRAPPALAKKQSTETAAEPQVAVEPHKDRSSSHAKRLNAQTKASAESAANDRSSTPLRRRRRQSDGKGAANAAATSESSRNDPYVLDEDFTGGRWFECAPPWPAVEADRGRSIDDAQLELAERLLREAASVYRARFQKGGGKATGDDDASWRSTAKREGTASDRIAALTLSVQESPVHHVGELEELLGMLKVKAARVKQMVIRAVEDLARNDLLPDRTLVSLKARRLPSNPRVTKRQWIYAAFESRLKSMYAEYVEVLNLTALEMTPYTRSDALNAVYNLLAEKPERENTLLWILVNKFGDPERKVASKATYLLGKLLEKHPAMKAVVLREVEQLLFRPNIKRRAQYYATAFLAQIKYRSGDEAAARKAVRMFMALFDRLTSDETITELDIQESRIVGLLLIGVNRAFPFTNAEADELYDVSQFEALFRVAHAHALRSSTQALVLLFQVSQLRESMSDRFYRTLYGKMLEPELRTTKNPTNFLNLLYRSMKNDSKPKRQLAFAKRLLQTAMHASAGFAAGALMVLSETLMLRPASFRSCVEMADAAEEREHFVDVDRENGRPAVAGGGDDVHILSGAYDPNKREPCFCNADDSSLWELAAMNWHFHPSVRKFAEDMALSTQKAVYEGNPLVDFALAAFLDRFVYRKPKRSVQASLSSAGARPLADSAEFEQLVAQGKLAEDEKYFLRYVKNRKPRDAQHKPLPKRREGDDEEDEIDRAFEDALRMQFGGSMLADDDDDDDDRVEEEEEEEEEEEMHAAGEDADNDDTESSDGDDEEMGGGLDDGEDSSADEMGDRPASKRSRSPFVSAERFGDEWEVDDDDDPHDDGGGGGDGRSPPTGRRGGEARKRKKAAAGGAVGGARARRKKLRRP